MPGAILGQYLHPLIIMSSPATLTQAHTAPEPLSQTGVSAPPELKPSDLFINRELSMLAFNRRVLDLAQDATLPLLERLRFLCISSTNLDEFFEIRVSGLRQQVALGLDTTPPEDGLSPQQQLAQISEQTHQLVADQYQV